MTDDHVSPERRRPPDDLAAATDRATADRVRRTLSAAAPTDTQVTAGLDDLRRRLGGAVVVPLAPAHVQGRSRRPLALAAAAVLLLVVTAVVMAGVVERDDGPDKVGGTGGVATGWYVPSPLPDGWEVDSITSDFMDVEGFGGTCPCRVTTWMNAAKDQTLVETAATAFPARGDGSKGPAVSDTDGRPVDLGDGVDDARLQPLVGLTLLGWEQKGRSTFLAGRGLSDVQMIAAARLVLRSDGDEPPLAGLEQVDQAVAPDGVESFQSVSVNLRNPQQRRVASYTMVPSGFGGDLNLAPTPVSVSGQRLPLLSLRSPVDEGEPEASIYFGRWPGADLTLASTCDYCTAIPASTPGGEALANRQATDDQVRAIIASLRPADAATWKALIRAHPSNDDPDLAVDSIDDLTRPGHAGGAPGGN